MSPAANRLLVDTATPPIPEAKAWLAAYDGARGPAIDLSQAVPGDPPPDVLLQALTEAAADPATASYGPIAGEAALREAYAADLSRIYGAAVKPEHSAITSGCNQAFVLALLATAAAGDEVMLPSPWYFNHKMALDMLGIGCASLSCRPENGFVPDPDEAAGLVSARTRAIVLVTPNNPTGAIYPPETIARFAALARARGLWLILDETYRDFLPPDMTMPPHRLHQAYEHDGAISLYSFSKAYALPGYRIGAITAPTLMGELGKAMDTLQICAPRVGQIAVARTMAQLQPWRAAAGATIHRRGMIFADVMAKLDGWRIGSIGAYFAYVRPPGEAASAVATARRLATREGVLMLPGGYFGPEQDGWLRVAFANAGEASLQMLGERLSDL